MARRRKGGPRTPDTPALFSGPGASSSRTDGAPKVSEAPVARHGEGPVVEALEQAGGGGGGGVVGGAGAGVGGQAGTPGAITNPFEQATQRPDEDMFTSPGQAPPTPGDPLRESNQFIDLMTLGPALPILEALASRPGSSITMRNIVRRLRSQLPPDFDFATVFTNAQMVLAPDEADIEDVSTGQGEGAP